MLFNSITFIFFLPAVFFGYWWLGRRSLQFQNIWLLAASFLFYGWWDFRFLGLLVFSAVIDYFAGLAIHSSSDNSYRKKVMLLSMASNLTILGFFKYFNFFIHSFAALLTSLGMQPNLPSLQIILPVGISFYTFQSMSYAIDVYRRHLVPTKNIVDYFAFVSFFPQLVAGPIERASNLLPQFGIARHFDFDKARDGVRQMLWGFFKKMVVADTAAGLVSTIFSNTESQDSILLVVGAFLFAIQIYGDFSGYSDIAIGCARLFGFELMRNFAFPYFSRDIGEFWRRWHISLSSWFRDYVFIPLGGSRTTRLTRMRNIILTFTISGFWHGANWTFILWGLLHGLYYVPLMLLDKHKQHSTSVAHGRLVPSIGEFFSMGATFVLVLIGWIFFRADSLSHAFQYLKRIASGPYFDHSLYHTNYLQAVLFSLLLLGCEWLQRERHHALEVGHWPVGLRWGSYVTVALLILLFGNFGEVDFIYFQF